MSVNAIVEIPKGCNYKYEIHEGELVVDRVLNQNVPYSYGYIPDTLCEDGDPLDIFIISRHPIHPTTKVAVYLMGVFECTDGGKQDDKLVGILVGESSGDLRTCVDTIQNYLQSYKEGFVVNNYYGLDRAREILEQSRVLS